MRLIHLSMRMPWILILLLLVAPVSADELEKVCYKCHSALEKRILKEKTHDPVKRGKCVTCHNPHTSNHKGLLVKSQDELCNTCHKKDATDEFSRSVVHEPVKNGKCLACHDPHASTNKKLLIKTKKELCFTCHAKDLLISGKESHPLVRKGDCMACHAAHSSPYEGLLVKTSGDLCSKCHNVEKDQFVLKHANYPVENSDCSSCHNPHSSNSKSLLKAYTHLPVAEGKCTACHNSANSNNPLKLKSMGNGLCYDCHQDIKAEFKKTNNHMTGNRGNICLNCHNPHASDSKALLAGSEKKICYKCHSDTMERYSGKAVKFKHPELEKCSSCHSAHGSEYNFFLTEKEADSCSSEKCHIAQLNFSHPVGPEAVDHRNGKEMTCLTCHNPMGAGYKNHLRLDPNIILCAQCHKI